MAAIARDGGLEVVTPIDVFPGPGQEEIGMQHKRRHPDGTWTSWARLGLPRGGFSEGITPALIPGRKGVLELFAISAAGTVWRNSQPAGGNWSGWAPLGDAGGAVTGIAVAASADGGLDLCATGGQHGGPLPPGRPGRPVDGLDQPGRADAGPVAGPALVLDSENCLNLFLSRPQDEGLTVLRQKSPERPVHHRDSRPRPATALDAASARQGRTRAPPAAMSHREIPQDPTLTPRAGWRGAE